MRFGSKSAPIILTWLTLALDPSEVQQTRVTQEDTMKHQLISMVLVVLLAGCGSTIKNAYLPDPGGGFYCPHNAFEGCVNPPSGEVP
jgi:hypothetical protein